MNKISKLIDLKIELNNLDNDHDVWYTWRNELKRMKIKEEIRLLSTGKDK